MTIGKRGWILIGFSVPALALIGLLSWAMVKPGGNPGGLGVNNKPGEVEIQTEHARDFTVALMDGNVLSLSDLRGKVVMVDFWASWCPPCRQESPVLVQVYDEYSDRDVEFVGIDIWDSPDAARDYVRDKGLVYPNAIDAQGVIAIDYGVRGIPEKYFIGKDGVLFKKLVGPTDAVTLRATLDELLVAGGSGSN